MTYSETAAGLTSESEDWPKEIVTFVAEDVEVERWPDFEDFEIVEGVGEHYGKVLYRDQHKRISFGIWECPPSIVDLEYGPMGESIQCVKGHATITDLSTGKSTELTPGVRVILPVGTKVRWHIHELFRKSYSVYEAEWDGHRYY
jgi:uncharacterized cupin superfamily protein